MIEQAARYTDSRLGPLSLPGVSVPTYLPRLRVVVWQLPPLEAYDEFLRNFSSLL